MTATIRTSPIASAVASGSVSGQPDDEDAAGRCAPPALAATAATLSAGRGPPPRPPRRRRASAPGPSPRAITPPSDEPAGQCAARSPRWRRRRPRSIRPRASGTMNGATTFERASGDGRHDDREDGRRRRRRGRGSPARARSHHAGRPRLDEERGEERRAPAHGAALGAGRRAGDDAPTSASSLAEGLLDELDLLAVAREVTVAERLLGELEVEVRVLDERGDVGRGGEAPGPGVAVGPGVPSGPGSASAPGERRRARAACPGRGGAGRAPRGGCRPRRRSSARRR